jgi:hypothetical protein
MLSRRKFSSIPFSCPAFLTLRPLGARLPILPLNPIRAHSLTSPKIGLGVRIARLMVRNTPSVGVQAVVY